MLQKEKTRGDEINRPVSGDSWESPREVDKTAGWLWWGVA